MFVAHSPSTDHPAETSLIQSNTRAAKAIAIFKVGCVDRSDDLSTSLPEDSWPGENESSLHEESPKRQRGKMVYRPSPAAEF